MSFIIDKTGFFANIIKAIFNQVGDSKKLAPPPPSYTTKKDPKRRAGKSAWIPRRTKAKWAKSMAMVGLPSLFVAFSTFYFIVGFSFYFRILSFDRKT